MKLLLGMILIPLAALSSELKNEWTPSWQSPTDGFNVTKKALGAGTPSRGAVSGVERATPVADGLYHIPGVMPGFPTAATIWPRVVPVKCNEIGEQVECDGYHVNLASGRGEYIYIQPHKPALPINELTLKEPEISLKPVTPTKKHHRGKRPHKAKVLICK